MPYAIKISVNQLRDELLVEIFVIDSTVADPIKLFFFVFFFGIRLGHLTKNNVFLYVTNTQAYQQKTEKFFISEEN